MPSIISENQTFIEGRQILDGSLIANEVTKWANLQKKKLLLLKVDIAKAFDCLNWTFLDSILQRMEFSERWRSWIKECLSSAKIFVLVNDSPTNEFSMEREVRQGDPISPFLFIIAAEAIHVILDEATDVGIFQGSHLDSMRETISHLQFADDALFFSEWSYTNAANLLHILKCFEAAWSKN